MIKDYITINIKIDNFKVYDYDRIKRLAEVHGVPDKASVRITTSGLGTMITFEWAELSDKEIIEKYGYKHYAAQSGRINDWRKHYKK